MFCKYWTGVQMSINPINFPSLQRGAEVRSGCLVVPNVVVSSKLLDSGSLLNLYLKLDFVAPEILVIDESELGVFPCADHFGLDKEDDLVGASSVGNKPCC